MKTAWTKASLFRYAENIPKPITANPEEPSKLSLSTRAESVQDDPTPPRSFSLEEIRVATQNFSRDNFLAEYYFHKFYRGRLADGSLVLVKRACRVDQWGEEKFEAEMQVGSTVSGHPNVLRLRGFCRTKKELLLVFPLMINNSLSYNLRERPDRFARPLDWTTRKQIALGAARGLAHLHNQGNIKIVHRGICSSDIQLNGHFEAVIGGFSIAVIMHERNMKKGIIEPCPYRRSDQTSVSESHLCEDVYVETEPCGVYGFIAPEYFLTGKCTPKIDVYSYGRMLLELITGKSISEIYGLLDDEDLGVNELTDFLMKENKLGRLLDPNLQGNYVEEEAERLLGLAMLCSDVDPSIRPKMSEVVRMLESQFLQRDTSTRSSWSQSECDSTPYYSLQGDSTPYNSLPPSPSPSHLKIAP